MLFLKQQLSASQHSQDVKNLAHCSTPAHQDTTAGALARLQTAHGTEDCDQGKQQSEGGKQGTEGGATHCEAEMENSSRSRATALNDERQAAASEQAQLAESSQEPSGCPGQNHRLSGASGVDTPANPAQQTIPCNLEPQANVLMESIDRGLSPGHLVTKELVDKIVRYAEVAKVLKRSHDELAEANRHLQSRFLTADQELATLRTSMSTCEAENVELRELGTLLSSVVKVRGCFSVHS